MAIYNYSASLQAGGTTTINVTPPTGQTIVITSVGVAWQCQFNAVRTNPVSFYLKNNVTGFADPGNEYAFWAELAYVLTTATVTYGNYSSPVNIVVTTSLTATLLNGASPDRVRFNLWGTVS